MCPSEISRGTKEVSTISVNYDLEKRYVVLRIKELQADVILEPESAEALAKAIANCARMFSYGKKKPGEFDVQ